MRYTGPFVFAVFSLAWAPTSPTKHDQCRVMGSLPDPTCTPGAIATTDLRLVCRTSTRGRRHVPRNVRRQVFVAYGLSPDQPQGAYEIDHLIPLELGGSNSLANLWPQAAPEFHDKDRAEDTLHHRVCSGKMTLDEAQRMIATDWTVALREGHGE
jgi:hypothetical protein